MSSLESGTASIVSMTELKACPQGWLRRLLPHKTIREALQVCVHFPEGEAELYAIEVSDPHVGVDAAQEITTVRNIIEHHYSLKIQRAIDIQLPGYEGVSIEYKPNQHTWKNHVEDYPYGKRVTHEGEIGEFPTVESLLRHYSLLLREKFCRVNVTLKSQEFAEGLNLTSAYARAAAATMRKIRQHDLIKARSS